MKKRKETLQTQRTSGSAGSSGRAPEAGRRKRTDRNGFLQDALGNRRFPSPFSRAMVCAASAHPGLLLTEQRKVAAATQMPVILLCTVKSLPHTTGSAGDG